jgi:hypothetical protein
MDQKIMVKTLTLVCHQMRQAQDEILQAITALEDLPPCVESRRKVTRRKSRIGFREDLIVGPSGSPRVPDPKGAIGLRTSPRGQCIDS